MRASVRVYVRAARERERDTGGPTGFQGGSKRATERECILTLVHEVE